MKDEIKEILNNLQKIADIECYPEEILFSDIAQKWIDYITNLQEENCSHINRIHELEQEIDSEFIQKEYYKSRNEKANSKLRTMFDNGNEETILDDLLELDRILNGGNKE